VYNKIKKNMQPNQKKYLVLKFVLCFFIIFFNSFCSNAQIFKRIKEGIKANAENKIVDKVNEKINQKLDSLQKQHSKKKDANTTTDNAIDTTSSSSPNADSTNTYNTSSNDTGTDSPDKNSQGQQDGYVVLNTSANTTFIGASVIISGESVFYEKYNSVGLTIQGPYSEDADPKPVSGFTKLVKQISLDKDGKYNTLWNVGGTDGQYKLTVVSSDGKATKTKLVIVYSWPDMGDIADSNITQTNKAYDKLVKKVDDIKPSISAKDAADLDKKMADIKDKKDAAIKLFTSLNEATKKLGAMVKKGKGLPPNLNTNLSDLRNALSSQASDMEKMDEFTNHEPSDNSICEYLVMVNEACAAFSTFTNIWSKSIVTIVTNITTDKVVPKGIETGNNVMGNPVPSDNDILLKEPGKLFATSAIDAESLLSKMGAAGIAGDITQYVSGYLLKKYCGVYEGTVKHDYTVIFRNDDHKIWWKYGVEMEATISLRYPKDKTGGRIIKMKGNIEGNATKFTFFADAKEAVKDEMQGRDKFVSVVVLRDFLPPCVPFATSQKDKMGFGAAARAIATPAYFNIPIDADYDSDAGKIKFFINPALIDFTDAVENREIYMVIAVLPMVRWMEYPIFKAQRMIKGSFKEKNEFYMAGGKSPYVNDKAIRHIGTDTGPFEMFLNTSFNLKKQ
jgi:hypothetical protein